MFDIVIIICAKCGSLYFPIRVLSEDVTDADASQDEPPKMEEDGSEDGMSESQSDEAKTQSAITVEVGGAWKQGKSADLTTIQLDDSQDTQRGSM